MQTERLWVLSLSYLLLVAVLHPMGTCRLLGRGAGVVNLHGILMDRERLQLWTSKERKAPFSLASKLLKYKQNSGPHSMSARHLSSLIVIIWPFAMLFSFSRSHINDSRVWRIATLHFRKVGFNAYSH